jgi:hypothetical protein
MMTAGQPLVENFGTSLAIIGSLSLMTMIEMNVYTHPIQQSVKYYLQIFLISPQMNGRKNTIAIRELGTTRN